VALRLVVGLGNPGEEYSRTRHNVGFMLADRLAGESADWKWFEGDLGQWTRSPSSIYIVKPMTYMNLSGDCVQRFAAFYKIKPEEILVVTDDLALPLGRLRIRKEGSAGGQKGLKHILERMGTQAVPRLRVGIGPQPQFMDSAAFVLQKFKSDEQKIMEEVLGTAVEAVGVTAEAGLDSAMNRYNPKA
jgi:PTH1 family peptidyl-tRNA hydrolase